MFVDVAAQIDIHPEELVQQLEESGFMDMIFGYLFEQFATSHWDDEDFSLIDDYLKRRGWREAPYARRYLSALNESEVTLWEAMSVKSGHFVDVRVYGTDDKPFRVYEQSGSQNLKKWTCLAGRVVTLDGKKAFSGSLLPFSPEQAQEILQMLARTIDNTVNVFEEIQKEDPSCDWSDEQIKTMAIEQAEELLPDLLFSRWAGDTYISITKPLPTIVNRDGELFQWSKVRFPVKENHADEIRKRLNSARDLDLNIESNQWTWLADDTLQPGTSILGHLSLSDSHLELTANSIERVEDGKVYLTEMLGELIGQPMAVHENLDSLMERYSQDKLLDSSEPVDAPELVSEFLDQHYRKILDESIPALNGKTPRECAQGAGQHQLLTHWLKGLENNTMSAPHMAHYDFKWMWEELGVKYPE